MLIISAHTLSTLVHSNACLVITEESDINIHISIDRFLKDVITILRYMNTISHSISTKIQTFAGMATIPLSFNIYSIQNCTNEKNTEKQISKPIGKSSSTTPISVSTITSPATPAP
jgi:hypothetical protein